MRAIDTNILVYARRADTPHHAAALATLRRLAEGPDLWAIPWPCVYEFVRVVTHPRVFHPPSPLADVVRDLRELFASPTLQLLGETDHHAEAMAAVLAETPATGNLVHDAHIAALLREHGVSELLTADGDFARFTGFRVSNPVAASGSP
jgi:toxin-antitoxin system PIN domain toxin